MAARVRVAAGVPARPIVCGGRWGPWMGNVETEQRGQAKECAEAGQTTDRADALSPQASVRRIEAELRRALPTIEDVPLDKVKPRERNARRHSKKQIEQIADSIRKFGFIGAIIIDRDGNILAGHGRYAATRLLGWRTIPCVRVDHLDEVSKAAFALADNRLAEFSDWDDEILKLELKELEAAVSVDVEITGFDTVDLDRLLGPEPDPNTNRDDEVPVLFNDCPAVSRLGDLWTLDQHRLLCGDALDPESYARLLGEEKAAQIVSDPPYNVRIAGNVSTKASFREFATASGEMTATEFVAFLARWLTNARNVAREGAIFYTCMDWRHMEEMQAAIRSAELQLMNLCVWVKPNAGLGSFYRSQHELIFVSKHGNAPHINNFGLGGRGRTRSNVWHYPTVVHGKGINDPQKGHPTPKPVAMLIDALKDCSRRGDIILDPFGGSGSTLIAAERVGRLARLIELDRPLLRPHHPALAGGDRWHRTPRRWPQLFRSRTHALGGSRNGDRPMSDDHDDDYRVGPGRPPKHTRFKPGQSGNPKGRPKGRTNLVAVLERELMRMVEVSENGQTKRVTKQAALARSIIHRGIKGDHKSAELVMRHLAQISEAETAPSSSEFQADDELLERLRKRLTRVLNKE